MEVISSVHDAAALPALIATYVPRACGIATFTADLRRALATESGRRVPVIALDRGSATDPDSYPPEVVGRLGRGEPAAFERMGRRLDALGVDVVSVQHEFGIFGGEAGSDVLDIIDACRCPVVTTLHTIPVQPDGAQRRVLTEVARRSAKVVVMSRRGRELLAGRYEVATRSIDVIPHGVPDIAFHDPLQVRSSLGVGAAPLILSFGLISPNKGLELALEAFARALPAAPETRFVIAGATHPEVRSAHGEAYRESLQALATSLGIGHRLHLVDRYLSPDELAAWVRAADIFVTPYGDSGQVTSGTLAYAVAAGKAVVSTPYEHALELLADGRGALAPFGDPDAFGDRLRELLTHTEARDRMRRAAWAYGRRMVWSAVARRYIEVFDAVATAEPTAARSAIAV